MTKITFDYSNRVKLGNIISINNDIYIFSLGNKKTLDNKSKKLEKEDIIKLMAKVIFFDNYFSSDNESVFSNDEILDKKIFIDILDTTEELIEIQIQAFYFFTYEPINFKTFTKNKSNIKFELLYDSRLKNLVEKNKTMVHFVNEIKNLIELPPDLINPDTLLKYILDFSKKNNLNILEVYDEDKLKSENLNGIVSVGRGSVHKSNMSIIEYRHNTIDENTKPIILIGKGITYDSGGYSLKRDMKNMKYDKTGVCIVLGILGVLAKLKVQTRVIAILPIAENVINNNSFKPDEIIKSHSGITVEVINTDAEGRLILMDALSISKNYNPRLLIDIATLTSVNVFCSSLGGIFSNNLEIAWEFQKISKSVCENYWVLPIIDDVIQDTRNTKLANVKNEGYKCNSSSVTAAAFLKNFVPDSIPWVHFDLGDSYSKFELANPKNLNSSNSFLTILKFILSS